ncbi:hypothetical protein GEMRC1_003337 [Eukaryota sp. GEM-RC1]
MIHRLSKTFSLLPTNGVSYPFISNFPTITSPRVATLMTGFPGSSPNPSPPSESTFSSLKGAGLNTCVAGDDTWQTLFGPDIGKSSFAYSFNVFDFDSVDDVVFDFFENNSSNCHLRVGHLLSVDHVGHVFGPFSDKMTERLTVIDDFVYNTFQNLPNNSYLFVISDHGMTDEGNHGGTTKSEIEGSMIAIKSRDISDHFPNSEGEVPHVNFASTLAYLFGVLPPRSNLGLVETKLLLKGFHSQNETDLSNSNNNCCFEYGLISRFVESMSLSYLFDFNNSSCSEQQCLDLKRFIFDLQSKFLSGFKHSFCLFAILIFSLVFILSVYCSKISLSFGIILFTFSVFSANLLEISDVVVLFFLVFYLVQSSSSVRYFILFSLPLFIPILNTEYLNSFPSTSTIVIIVLALLFSFFRTTTFLLFSLYCFVVYMVVFLPYRPLSA